MGSKMNTIRELAEFLGNIPPGPLKNETEAQVLEMLSECWAEFDGSADSKMAYWKVERDDGPEDLEWVPPVLRFVIVRHGSAVLGSTRGEKQQWSLNLEKKRAIHGTIGYVRLRPTAPRLDVKPIAAKIYEAVRKGRNSDSDLISNGVLAWNDDHIIIWHGKLIRADGYKMTVAGRRR